MKSMTGHGWGESAKDGYKVAVDIGAVNRKQSELAVLLPRDLDVLESRVRDEVNSRVARGRVTIRIQVESIDPAKNAGKMIHVEVAKAYAREFRQLAAELKIKDDLSLDTILRAPGVLDVSTSTLEPETYWPTIQKALKTALDAFIEMREREGKNLQKDLEHRVQLMRKAVKRVKKEAPAVQERFRETLRERIRDAGLPLPPEDDERLIKEIVYFADRSDITEELTRLESHFDQFESTIEKTEPVGRTLDFLAQEMNREINTLGAKANDSVIAMEVVLLKTELEKFREQVQNVE